MNQQCPELAQAVAEGRIKARLAAELNRRSYDTQRAIVAKVREGTAKNPRQALRQLKTERLAVVGADTNATVYTGDARVVLKTLAGPIHCVVTDPPYGLENHHANFAYRNKDYVDGIDAPELLRGVCEALVPKLANDAHLYVFSGYSLLYEFKQVLASFFDVQAAPLVWVKHNHSPCDFGKKYPNNAEYIWFAKVRGGDRFLDRMVKTVFTDAAERATDHSAEKPTALLQTLIEQSTVPGEHVVDPFTGSGSTGVAAKRAKRLFTGIELDPHWAAVSRGRISKV